MSVNIDLKRWSERQQVLAIILMGGLVIALLWFFLLLPQYRTRQQLDREIESGRNQLGGNYLVDESTLAKMKQSEQSYFTSLNSEWTATTTRITPFTNIDEVANIRMGHIDFKVALLEARRKLKNKADSLGISLPRDLGMEEVVRSDEDSRKLMVQLRTVEKIVDLALDLNLGAVKCIEPFPPVQHETAKSKEIFLEEYPVHVELSGKLDDLYSLFRGINRPGRVFVLKHIKIDAPQPGKPDVLSINCVLSGLVFMKKPADMAAKPRKIIPAGPAGH